MLGTTAQPTARWAQDGNQERMVTRRGEQSGGATSVCGPDCRYRSLYEGSQASLRDMAERQADALGRTGRLRKAVIDTLKTEGPIAFHEAETRLGIRMQQADDPTLIAYLRYLTHRLAAEGAHEGLAELRDALGKLGVVLPVSSDLAEWASRIDRFRSELAARTPPPVGEQPEVSDDEIESTRTAAGEFTAQVAGERERVDVDGNRYEGPVGEVIVRSGRRALVEVAPSGTGRDTTGGGNGQAGGRSGAVDVVGAGVAPVSAAVGSAPGVGGDEQTVVRTTAGTATAEPPLANLGELFADSETPDDVDASEDFTANEDVGVGAADGGVATLEVDETGRDVPNPTPADTPGTWTQPEPAGREETGHGGGASTATRDDQTGDRNEPSNEKGSKRRGRGSPKPAGPLRPSLFPTPTRTRRRGGRTSRVSALPPDPGPYDVPPEGESTERLDVDEEMKARLEALVVLPRPCFTSDLAAAVGSEEVVAAWEQQEREQRSSPVRFIFAKSRYRMRGSLVVPHGAELRQIADDNDRHGWWSACRTQFFGRTLYELAVVMHRIGEQVVSHRVEQHALLFRLHQPRGTVGLVIAPNDAFELGEPTRQAVAANVEELLREPLEVLVVLTVAHNGLDPLIEMLLDEARRREWQPSCPVVAARSWEYADENNSAIMHVLG